jgi:hypothetical protein
MPMSGYDERTCVLGEEPLARAHQGRAMAAPKQNATTTAAVKPHHTWKRTSTIPTRPPTIRSSALVYRRHKVRNRTARPVPADIGTDD